jgi:hypothetical protein
MKHAKFIVLFLSLVLAVVASPLSSFAQAWPPGKITNTQTTTPRSCVGGQPNGAIVAVSNWAYTDSAGVRHPFKGTSYIYTGSPGLCNDYTTGFTDTEPDGNGSITLTANGSSGTIAISANVFPQYHILSLLYDAPGNQSSAGIMDTTFYGVTNSITNTFNEGITLSYTVDESFFGIGGGGGASVTFSQGYGTTNAFTNTITNGQSLTLKSARNPVDHTNDTFWIWLNPQVTVTQIGSGTATYTLSPPSGQVMDAVRVSVAELQNPSTIPPAVLGPITINGVVYPGLSNICAKPSECVSNDFAAILATDPIISITSNTSPAQIDPKRYFALNPPPSPFPFLEFGTSDGLTLTDQSQTAQTQTETTSYSTSWSSEEGVNIRQVPVDFSLQLRETDTFTWTQSVGLTNFSGTSHQMNLTLATSTSGCDEAIDVYEDYDYHTFVSVPASTPPVPCDSN